MFLDEAVKEGFNAARSIKGDGFEGVVEESDLFVFESDAPPVARCAARGKGGEKLVERGDGLSLGTVGGLCAHAVLRVDEWSERAALGGATFFVVQQVLGVRASGAPGCCLGLAYDARGICFVSVLALTGASMCRYVGTLSCQASAGVPRWEG